MKIIIISLSSLLICALVYYILKNFNKMDKITINALAMILGGGIGNLIDRVSKGFVVDYIDINYLIKYPIFNLADIFIVIGTIVIIGNLIFRELTKQEK